MIPGVFGRVEEQIDFVTNGVVPVLDGKLADFAKTRSRSIVVEDVDSAMFGHCRLNPGPGLLVVAEIDGRLAVQTQSFCVQQGSGFPMRDGIHVAAHHNRSFTGEAQCCCPALTTAGPGNQSNLTFKTPRHCTLHFLFLFIQASRQRPCYSPSGLISSSQIASAGQASAPSRASSSSSGGTTLLST
ncbi:hypothetical protein D3C84_714080 [compost metagenome]